MQDIGIGPELEKVNQCISSKHCVLFFNKYHCTEPALSFVSASGSSTPLYLLAQLWHPKGNNLVTCGKKHSNCRNWFAQQRCVTLISTQQLACSVSKGLRSWYAQHPCTCRHCWHGYVCMRTLSARNWEMYSFNWQLWHVGHPHKTQRLISVT